MAIVAHIEQTLQQGRDRHDQHSTAARNYQTCVSMIEQCNKLIDYIDGNLTYCGDTLKPAALILAADNPKRAVYQVHQEVLDLRLLDESPLLGTLRAVLVARRESLLQILQQCITQQPESGPQANGKAPQQNGHTPCCNSHF